MDDFRFTDIHRLSFPGWVIGLASQMLLFLPNVLWSTRLDQGRSDCYQWQGNWDSIPKSNNRLHNASCKISKETSYDFWAQVFGSCEDCWKTCCQSLPWITGLSNVKRLSQRRPKGHHSHRRIMKHHLLIFVDGIDGMTIILAHWSRARSLQRAAWSCVFSASLVRVHLHCWSLLLSLVEKLKHET